MLQQQPATRPLRPRAATHRRPAARCPRCSLPAATPPPSPLALAATSLFAAALLLAPDAVHAAAAGALLQPHGEPANALSLPTWAVHTSSVGEWVASMWLLVSLGERSNRPGLVALAWAMMPLHFSSLCACTYHVFYNAPSLAPLVALQAASTAVGNATMAAAAIRLAREPSRAGAEPASGWGVLEFAASWSPEDSALLGKTLAWSVISAAVIKYGSLWLGWPLFGDADGALVSPAPLGVALAVICGGTAATAAALAERCARWTPRSPPPVAEAAVDGAATQQQQQPGA